MSNFKKTDEATQVKPEIRTWYAFEGRLGEIIHNNGSSSRGRKAA